MISSYVLDFTKGAVQGVMIIFSFFHPAGKAGGSQIRRCQGIAVKRYGFTLGVLALTPSGFCNVRVARLGIEGEVGRLCAELATDRHLARIRKLRGDCVLLTDRKDPGALVEIDRRFRRILHDAAGNPVLQSVSDQLYTLTFRLWYVTLDKGEWQDEVREMRDEIDATLTGMEARNGKATSRARREALMRHFDRIRAKYLGVPSEMKL
jgi:DNA-binding GntR family transcriptional regulator